jgi:hypothetical protein
VAPCVLCPFVVFFAFKPRTNLAMNFVRLLSAKVRDLNAARHQLSRNLSEIAGLQMVRFGVLGVDSGS